MRDDDLEELERIADALRPDHYDTTRRGKSPKCRAAQRAYAEHCHAKQMMPLRRQLKAADVRGKFVPVTLPKIK